MRARLQGWFYAALAVLGALLGVYVLGRKDGASAARVTRLENELGDMQEAYDVTHEISGLDRGAVDERLAQWVRPEK